MSLKLYFAPGSCAFASLIALEEAQAEFEAIPVALAAGEQRTPGFLAISPRGQIPVLRVGEAIVRENIAVLTCIANLYPEARLLPLGQPVELAKAYEVMSWFATNLHVAIAQIWRGERFTDNADTKAELTRYGKIAFERALATFNDLAAHGGPWLMGDQFSVADGLAPVAFRWASRLAMDLAPYDDFTSLVSRVEARPSWAKATAQEKV
jgi:glutathione S-transferase